MQDSWRVRRKKTFIYSVTFIILALLVYKAYPYLNPAPTCFDKVQNGEEDGVDCGGACQLICATAILPVEVKTASAIAVEKDLYDLVAIVQNKNIDKEPENGLAKYRFYIYDTSGSLLQTLDLASPLMLGQTFPILIQNMPFKLASAGNAISKVVVEALPNNQAWLKVDPVYAKSFLSVENLDFKQNYNNISQLQVTLKNLTKANLRNIPVRVVLKDRAGNFIATNETLIKEIKASDVAYANFTWRIPLELANPEIEVYPITTPLTEFN